MMTKETSPTTITLNEHNEEKDVETFCRKVESVNLIQEDGYFVGDVPGCNSILAYGETKEECQDDLKSTIKDLVDFRLSKKQQITFEFPTLSCKLNTLSKNNNKHFFFCTVTCFFLNKKQSIFD